MPQHLRNRLNNIRPLRVFSQVYELGSITLAAEALNLTQPTVSIQLRQLAELIDTPLYQLRGKKLIFTEAGHLMARYCQTIMAATDTLESELANLMALKAGTLRVAVVTSAKYFIPHLLGEFCHQYPLIDVVLKVGNRDKILGRYQQGLDDIYLFSHLEPDMIDSAVRFLPNRLYPVAHKEHPLAGKKAISIKEFLDYPILAREQGSGTRFAIEKHLAGLQLPFRPKLVIESNEAIKHCVLADMGVAILSEYALHYEPNENITFLPVDHFPIKTYWHIVKSPLKLQTPLSTAFIQHLADQANSQQ
ncbi:LysR family transcriptional regulator [Photobacterium atrarenae]|uniref:LysR family transcriptional regulator n=1 Tax=Photobacterium atrarenae TaxID=865757 RepID=A0ABY5GPS4_9GAMM|nr:LysR family transcriptional regulator [Photobacterium atrarenae]UTV30820.1 LysR family transcriptional regulator [Photobacterium atrarenae]